MPFLYAVYCHNMVVGPHGDDIGEEEHHERDNIASEFIPFFDAHEKKGYDERAEECPQRRT